MAGLETDWADGRHHHCGQYTQVCGATTRSRHLHNQRGVRPEFLIVGKIFLPGRLQQLVALAVPSLRHQLGEEAVLVLGEESEGRPELSNSPLRHH